MKRLSIVFALVVAALCVPLFTACAGGQKGTKYTIDAVYDDQARTLTAEMTLDFCNDTDNALTELRFHLFGNAYRQGAKYEPIAVQNRYKAYYDGINYGSMTVTASRSAEKRPLIRLAGRMKTS